MSQQNTRNILRKLKRVEMDFYMTMGEAVEQAKATEVMITTLVTMTTNIICPTLTIVKESLQVQV